MLQDLYPHVYHNEMAWKAPAPDDIALIFAPDRTIYCGLEGSTLTLPRMRDITDGEVQYAFSIDETASPRRDRRVPLSSFRVAPRHDGRDKRRPVRRRSGREPAPLV